MRSLLNKAKEANVKYSKCIKLKDDYDRAIIIGLLNIRNVLKKSINTRSLNDIAEHLYKITNLYNNFYSNNHVLTEEEKELQESWLLLTKVVYENNLKMLNILGIKVPDRM
jgi:arginyl-tRNA synthetase